MCVYVPVVQSALRIMDCFLLEGVKFLFRASLSVFRLYEQSILQLHDQLAVLQFCKEVPKHVFDIEALFQVGALDSLYTFSWSCHLSFY